MILEMIFEVLESIRRIFGDFGNFDFLGPHVGHLPEEEFRGKLKSYSESALAKASSIDASKKENLNPLTLLYLQRYDRPKVHF